ncbi:MAG: Homoserine kinase [Candidatus Jorgensenbacteria bacterium GW2011_GWA1_48_13]|uniref:Homoserine kinase n=1 Tax=Candidatus Jorgensenbacteria bacterium GW2011_GWB1_50_10 TaxID=1618665 RepID=A0A0G1W9D6_9BACT|nr:MAG: Homoserine kinase [Parcubacteria group bacterium GW2011_GWC1_45_9]KKU94065.1 MAG: Homoserine kinase [Candidatus Jorgensenbacteria bacterium GW2011_GWA1_48_13]KKW15170.1 MAG: Homoserine kinase [Candidatus Jorgensenbacteria bacterium GW2011_GWB1_50_10]
MLKFFSRKEYEGIADLFNLGRIDDIDYFRQGYQTPKVVITTPKGRFIVAKHNLSSKKVVVADMKIVPRIALLHEISFLTHLKRLPVPHYIRSSRGKYLENFKGYAVSAYRFLQGRQPRKITLRMAYQLGKFVGEFHRLGSKFRKRMLGRRRFYDLNPKVMALMYRYAKKQTHPELKAVVEEVRQGVENNRLPRGFPRGPIHVDIKPDNELFVGDKLTGVIDFGNTYVDTFIFDVGKTIMWNCLNKRGLDGTLIKKFLEGYNKKRKLSKKENNYLKQSILFAIYSHLWVDLYHVPIRYVPESYTLFLVREFLPLARRLEKEQLLL